MRQILKKIVLTTFLVLLIGIPIGLFLVGRRVPDCWYPNLSVHASDEQYGKFKPAYVSQDGEVLDVTRKSSLLKDDGDEEMFANRKKPKQQPEP